jgi:hypothetical protein
MIRHSLTRAALGLLACAGLLVPPVTSAQAVPPEVSRTATCLTIMLEVGPGGALAGPASVEPAGPGWRIVLPLLGQPFANREMQSPPPLEDVLSWFDLASYPSEAHLPTDRDVMSERAMVTPDGTAWYLRAAGGYYWLLTNHRMSQCFRLMNDARQVWPQG